MNPLTITLRSGIEVEVKPTTLGEIAVLIRPLPGGLAAYAVGNVDEIRSGDHDKFGGWSFWIGRTSIELETAAQLTAVECWIKEYRAELAAADRVAVEVPA